VLPACLTALLAGSLTACSGSSQGPALNRADAKPLATLASRIAHEGACAQRRDIQTLQQHTMNLVNARRVPEQLQDTLMSGVNALAADAPPCIPAVPVQTTPAPPAPSPHPPHPRPHPHPGPGPGHHHGHGGKDH
jgi:hypothetical protein